MYELPQDVQDEWIADWREANDKTIEYDPEVVWYPHRVVNRKQEAEMWAAWQYSKAHEKKPYRNADFTSWAAERDDEHPFHLWDGVGYVVTQEKPESDQWF